ncbi:DUF3293 domain-containing protein [Ferrovibrio terrae]|uniref:DUF3293 domain-containing protein n=1 Tax=Ferrovibrio terrae TaxID=2594003 RepID=A0A516H1P3_9PROT|nr:DUF3293 domain-containing protein [Ferrovibrio terrae]QDO97699.1 DUF3293 domain-containing protein [Ferrovibrio terrae]
MISAATLQGYRATTYAVTLPDESPLGLRLNEPSIQADAFLRRAKAQTITCLNAWNPRSIALPVTRNMAAHQRLRRDLAGYVALPHLGVPDRSTWRPEPGFAVLDLETEKAMALAQRHGQFGLVRYERGGVAELILTRLALK